jgi:uncharacterized membrane protein
MAQKMISATSYLIFFIPLLTPERKNPFVRYHLVQGAGLLLFAAILRGVIEAIAGPPYTSTGLTIFGLLKQPAHIVLLLLAALGIFNSFMGNTSQLPIIGKYAKRLLGQLL